SLFDGWQVAVPCHSLFNSTCDNWVTEYNLFVNHFSSKSHHGDWILSNTGTLANITIRFNIFADCEGTACITADNNPILGARIYGNVFQNANVGNGIIGTGFNWFLQNVLVYNNTFVNAPS